MKIIKPWIPFYKKYEAALARVSALEMVLSVMLESPKFIFSDMVGFNGQLHRKSIFLELNKMFNFDVIVETGTFIGDTTGYFASVTDIPILTCEFRKLFQSLAKSRLQSIEKIRFTVGDSRQFLREILEGKTDGKQFSKMAFFYLDAHWHEDLPLKDELQIIVKYLENFIIMVDDFQVPHDAGYGWDDYGRNKALNLETFKKLLDKLKLKPYFPNLPSAQESGGKRGCVILVPEGKINHQLQDVKTISSVK